MCIDAYKIKFFRLYMQKPSYLKKKNSPSYLKKIFFCLHHINKTNSNKTVFASLFDGSLF